MPNNLERLTETELQQLKAVFYSQAYEIVEHLQDLLLKLETDPDEHDALQAIKRHVHTLKGDSNSFGLPAVGILCHSVEDILSSLLDGAGRADTTAIELLLSCVDTINQLLVESESGAARTDIQETMGRIRSFLKQDAGGSAAQERSVEGEYTEYQQLEIQDAIRKGLNIYELGVVFHPMCGDRSVAQARVTEALSALGHVISARADGETGAGEKAQSMQVLLSATAGQEDIRRHASIPGITEEVHIKEYGHPEKQAAEGLKEVGVKGQILRVEVSRVDSIMNLVGELIIGRSMIEQVAREIEDGIPTRETAGRLIAAHAYMERTVSDLQKGVMKLRMVPINHVLRRFPKIVRDLCAEKGKKARLDIQGRETELDKSIVDGLGEPLAHLVRNMIDHGIEDPAYRRSIGKAEEGLITFRAYHEAARIVIEASDDGKGIDTALLKEKAIQGGILGASDVQRLSEASALELIFVPGLSTSEVVSETSGRGIGMNAVKSAIEGMKGSIEVESVLGEGTTFRLNLPLTLAVIKVLLFEVGGRLYAIPISAIGEVTRIQAADLTPVHGREALQRRDRLVPIIRLQELFGVNGSDGGPAFVLIVAIGGKNVGLLVDRLAGQQELVIKPVDGHYTGSGLVAGASILGDGRVVLLLDPAAMLKKAIEDEKRKLVEA